MGQEHLSLERHMGIWPIKNWYASRWLKKHEQKLKKNFFKQNSSLSTHLLSCMTLDMWFNLSELPSPSLKW